MRRAVHQRYTAYGKQSDSESLRDRVSEIAGSPHVIFIVPYDALQELRKRLSRLSLLSLSSGPNDVDKGKAWQETAVLRRV